MGSGFYGVMQEGHADEIYTYEAKSPEEAAALYLDSHEMIGYVVRVWMLGRHPSAYVLTMENEIREIESPPKVKK